LLERDEARKSALEHEANSVQSTINEIRKKNAEILSVMGEKRLEIQALKELEDISDKPLPEKKTAFNNLYDKKTDGK